MSDVWIAKEDIFYEGVRAHAEGHEVPDANVKAHGWQDKVVRPGTKTAAKALQSPES